VACPRQKRRHGPAAGGHGHHNFPGAHVPAKIRGVIEMKVYSDVEEVGPGEKTVIKVHLYNAKAATKSRPGRPRNDSSGSKSTPLTQGCSLQIAGRYKKGFPGEEYTITSNEPATRISAT